jgi:hypothetical protein
MAMIRKQVYIGPEEEAYLKSRARELGTTEAAVIRDLIKQDSRKLEKGHNAAADRLRMLMLKRRAALPNGGGTERFDREALYER